MANLALVIDPAPTLSGGNKVLRMLDKIERKALRVSNAMAKMLRPSTASMKAFETRLTRVENKFKKFGRTQDKVQKNITKRSNTSARSIGNLIKGFTNLFNVGGRAGLAIGEGAAAIGTLGTTAAVTAGLIVGLVAGLVLLLAGVVAVVLTIKLIAKTIKFVIIETIAWEKELINVAKTANLTDRGIVTLTKGIQGMLAVLPVTRTELLGIAEVAGQMGIQGVKNILKFTQAIAQLSLTSNIIGREGATAMARFLKVTNTGVRFVEELSSVITALGNNYAATESEILNMTTQLAQNVAAFDISAEKILSLSAVMKSLGIETEVGSSVVGRAFNEIANSIDKGGESLESLRKITRLSFDELKRLDSFDIFIKTLEGLRRVQEEGGNVSETLRSIGLEGVRNRKVLLTLANNTDQVADALALANAEMKDTNALFDEVARRSQTADASITLFQNSLTSAAAAFLETTGVSAAFFDEMTNLVHGFQTSTLESEKFQTELRIVAGNMVKAIKITAILADIFLTFAVEAAGVAFEVGKVALTIMALDAQSDPLIRKLVLAGKRMDGFGLSVTETGKKLASIAEILKEDPLKVFGDPQTKKELKAQNEELRRLNNEIREFAQASDNATRAILRQENAQRRLSSLRQQKQEVFRDPTSAVLAAAAGETDTEGKVREAAKKLRTIIDEELFLKGFKGEALTKELDRLVKEGSERFKSLLDLKNIAKAFRKNIDNMAKDVEKFFDSVDKSRGKTLIKIESVFGSKAEAEASANLKKFSDNLVNARKAELELIKLAKDAFNDQATAIKQSNDLMKSGGSELQTRLTGNQQAFESLRAEIEIGSKVLISRISDTDASAKSAENLTKAIENITSAATANRAIEALGGDFGEENQNQVKDLITQLTELGNISRTIQSELATQDSVTKMLTANENELAIITEQLNKTLKTNTQFTDENVEALMKRAKETLIAQIALTKLSDTAEAFKKATEDSTKPLEQSIKTLNEEILKLSGSGSFALIEQQAAASLKSIQLHLEDVRTAAQAALGSATTDEAIKITAALKQYEAAADTASMKTLQLKDRTIELTKEFERLKLTKEIADTLGDNFANAFTDIITGTKSVSEAFRDMANSILKEIIRITIAKQIAGAISNAIVGFASPGQAGGGGSFSGGGASVGFAKGGIVDSPTFMGTSGGRPVVAGEAGAEAVIPLTRVGGKLGISGKDINNSTTNIKNVTVLMTVVTKDADSMNRSRRQVVSGIKREIG